MVDAARCVRLSGRRREAKNESVRSVKSRDGIERADVCCGVNSDMNEVEHPTALSFAAKPSLPCSVVVAMDEGR